MQEYLASIYKHFLINQQLLLSTTWELQILLPVSAITGPQRDFIYFVLFIF